MKRSKFTDSQIIDALKRVDAAIAVPDICRELGTLALLPFRSGALNPAVWIALSGRKLCG